MKFIFIFLLQITSILSNAQSVEYKTVKMQFFESKGTVVKKIFDGYKDANVRIDKYDLLRPDLRVSLQLGGYFVDTELITSYYKFESADYEHNYTYFGKVDEDANFVIILKFTSIQEIGDVPSEIQVSIVPKNKLKPTRLFNLTGFEIN